MCTDRAATLVLLRPPGLSGFPVWPRVPAAADAGQSLFAAAIDGWSVFAGPGGEQRLGAGPAQVEHWEQAQLVHRPPVPGTVQAGPSSRVQIG